MTNDPQPGPAPIPVSVLTGFLGSGKTTLLSRLLRHPGMADTAVIINEFGEIGLDHHLVEAADGEPVVMSSGCLCCTVRNDLVDTLRGLYLKRVRGVVPEFRRVVIETTGLADPAPILHTLMEDPVVETYFSLDSVVTTVDAVHGESQLDAQPESVKQAAVADRLVLTKTDLASPEAVAQLQRRLGRLNPGAPLFAAVQGEIDPEQLFNAGLYNPETKSIDVRNWLRDEAIAAASDPHGHTHDHDDDNGYEHGHGHGHDHGHEARLDVNRHDARIRAHCLLLEEPLDWESFSLWLGSLASGYGDRLLRVKAILNIRGEPGPVAVHGVQHMFHPPARLPAWPDDDRRSKLVFITRDMERRFLEESLAAYRGDQAQRAS
ncbi:MAG TPA: GTP-binding protein [Alphaproteobacteria bacterium]|nr:GTP-binding protein [Alphaproteobacteria bacterium]